MMEDRLGTFQKFLEYVCQDQVISDFLTKFHVIWAKIGRIIPILVSGPNNQVFGENVRLAIFDLHYFGKQCTWESVTLDLSPTHGYLQTTLVSTPGDDPHDSAYMEVFWFIHAFACNSVQKIRIIHQAVQKVQIIENSCVLIRPA